MLSFFATLRVSGLASIVTAIKFSKISAGAESPLKYLEWGGLEPLSPPYSTPMPTAMSRGGGRFHDNSHIYRSVGVSQTYISCEPDFGLWLYGCLVL